MNHKNKNVAWSYSALTSYATCPKQYHEVKVLKKYKDDNENNRWGERVHKYFEKRLKGEVVNDPPLVIYDKIIERFSKTKGQIYVEQQLAITNSFKPTTWFGSDVWCRAKLDAMWIDGEKAKVVDWKTGKQKPDSKQLMLSALIAFVHHPVIDVVNTAFVWLQTGKMDVEKYRREDVSILWQEILPDVRRFEMAHAKQEWTPKPSGLCRNYCPCVDCHFNGRFKEHGIEVQV